MPVNRYMNVLTNGIIINPKIEKGVTIPIRIRPIKIFGP
jgi:hypothetical protein